MSNPTADQKTEWKSVGGQKVTGADLFPQTIEGLQRLKASLETDAQKAEAELRQAYEALERLGKGGGV